MSQFEKPAPMNGTEWKRTDTTRSATIKGHETRPYVECPHCGASAFRYEWAYRGGFISYHWKAIKHCGSCKYTELLGEEHELLPEMKRLESWLGRLKRRALRGENET